MIAEMPFINSHPTWIMCELKKWSCKKCGCKDRTEYRKNFIITKIICWNCKEEEIIK